jgi:hypothetical protein
MEERIGGADVLPLPMRRSDMAESVSRALSALQLARAATHWEKWDYARSLWTFKRELPDVAAILAALHYISELAWLKSLEGLAAGRFVVWRGKGLPGHVRQC